jgi:tetratricopeptide (TPR) repeat protein
VQNRVRADLTEACLMLARGYALRAGSGGEPLAAAVRLNELAERVAGAEVPRAVWDQRAELLRQLGRPGDADRAADRARDTQLITARDHYLAGAEALAAGRYRDALRLLRRSVDLDPASFWAHMSLGTCHEHLGQYGDAAGCYTTAIALWPDFHGGYYHRGRALLQLREFARARADLDRAAEMTPDAPEPFLDRALALQGLKEYAAAIRDLDRALELGAPAARAVLMRARLRDLAGDKDGAKRDLAEGMRQDPTDVVGWVARGNARLGSDLPGALADYDAALRVNPRSVAAMQNRSHVLSRLGRYPEAVRALDQLLEVYPDFTRARADRGVMHARLGNREAALADAEETLRRGSAASTSYQVACVYAHLSKGEPGYRADAIRLLTAALRAGYGFEHIETDKDLDPIRDTPEFRRVIESVRGLKPQAAARR